MKINLRNCVYLNVSLCVLRKIKAIIKNHRVKISELNMVKFNKIIILFPKCIKALFEKQFSGDSFVCFSRILSILKQLTFPLTYKCFFNNDETLK